MPYSPSRTAATPCTWPKRGVLHEIKPLLISPATVLFTPTETTLYHDKVHPNTAPAYLPPKTAFNHTVTEPIKSVMKLHTRQLQEEWNFQIIPLKQRKEHKELVSKKSQVTQDTLVMPKIKSTRRVKKPATSPDLVMGKDTSSLPPKTSIEKASPFIHIPYGKPLTPDRFDYYQLQQSLNSTQVALLPFITPSRLSYHEKLTQMTSNVLKLPTVAVLPRSPNVFPNRHHVDQLRVGIDREILSKNLETAVTRTEQQGSEQEVNLVDDLDLKLQICELVRNSHNIDHDISEILDLHAKKDHRIKSINTKKEIRMQKELRQKIMAAIAKNHVKHSDPIKMPSIHSPLQPLTPILL